MAELRAQITKAEYEKVALQEDNRNLKRQAQGNSALSSVLKDKSQEGKNLALEDTKRQVNELYELRDILSDGSKTQNLSPVSKAVKA